MGSDLCERLLLTNTLERSLAGAAADGCIWPIRATGGMSCLPVRVAVEAGRRTVGGPTGVGDTGVGVEGLGHIESTLIDQLPQLGDFANLLEGKDFILLVAIDSKPGRIVATVLETRQACRTKENQVSFEIWFNAADRLAA